MPVKLSTFNDGVVAIYKEKDRKTDFGAKRNASTLDDLEPVVSLAFEESSKRAQDLEFAEQSGFSLSLKVKTRYRQEVKTKMKAVIDGYLYDIANVDTDRRKLEMFLFLEGVREIAF